MTQAHYSHGYYEPHPLLVLDRPLVLVGHPGAGADQVGRVISGRTGLAFNDVERSVESIAGRSRSQILLEDGLERLRELEGAALLAAIHREPFGIVVMESGLLEDPTWREQLRDLCTVVYLRRPSHALLSRIQRQLERAPGSLPEFLVGAPRKVDELRTYLGPRESALREVDVIFEAQEGQTGLVASEILASLHHLVGVERVVS